MGALSLDARHLKQFEKLLLERKQSLLDEAEKAVGGMSAQGDELPDPGDRALLESNRNAMLRIRDRERKLIGKIDEALQRISDSSYGMCETCGGPIGVARLKVRPVTTLCISCKSAQEEDEERKRRSGNR